MSKAGDMIATLITMGGNKNTYIDRAVCHSLAAACPSLSGAPNAYRITPVPVVTKPITATLTHDHVDGDCVTRRAKTVKVSLLLASENCPPRYLRWRAKIASIKAMTATEGAKWPNQ